MAPRRRQATTTSATQSTSTTPAQSTVTNSAIFPTMSSGVLSSSSDDGATLTFNPSASLPIASPQPSSSDAVTVTQPGDDDDSGGLSGGAKVAIGVLAALAVLGILFSGTIWWLKKRANQNKRKDASRGVYEATLPYEFEEFNPGENSGFLADRKSVDDEQGHTYGGRARSGSQATRTSKRSSTSTSDYLKSRNKRDSVGSAYMPGVAMEEAYTMFGGSTADLHDDDDDESRPLAHRRSSSALAALPLKSGRRASLMSEGSRYPTMDSTRSRRSLSYSGGVDPFSDTTPTGSPAPLHRTFTSPVDGAASPKGGTSPPRGSPPSASQGRRISLQAGVGVQPKSPSPPGQP